MASGMKYASDSLGGAFAITSENGVRCGLCGLAFDTPKSKASHLEAQHDATVRRIRVWPSGEEMFEWQRAPK